MIGLLEKTDQPLLDILDITLERNSFGRQRESFETEISMDSINIPKIQWCLYSSTICFRCWL